MIELPTPDEQFVRFALAEEKRITKGRGIGPAEKAESWVDLAVPAVTPLTKSLIGKDEELLSFYEADRRRYAYDWIALGCTFGPADREQFSKAWLAMLLDGGVDTPGLKVWSMEPPEAYDTTQVERSLKLAGKFQFVSAEVGTVAKHPSKDWCLRAYPRTPEPYWEFRQTSLTPLNGYWPLSLIVRRPVGAKVSGKVTLNAEIKKSLFALFSEGQTAEAGGLPFDLG